MLKIPIDAIKLIEEKYGKHIMSYLVSYVKDKAYTKFVKQRAWSFKVGEQELQLYVDADYMSDIGGQWANNLNVVAAVDLRKGSKVLTLIGESVGFSATPENTMAVFVCRRFVDVAASTKYNKFLLSFSDGVIAVCVDGDGSKQRGALCTIDREGLIVRHSFNAEYFDSRSLSEYLSKNMVGRGALIKAFPDRLVGRDPDGSISYWRFHLSDDWSYEPVECAGFRGLMLNQPMSFARVESAAVRVEEESEQNWRNIINPIYLRPPEVNADIGGGGGSGGGAGMNTAGIIPVIPCERMGYRNGDECLNCCETRLATDISIAAGIGVGAVFGCPQFVLPLAIFFCYAAAATVVTILTTVAFFNHAECRDACNGNYGPLNLQPQ